MAYYGTMGCYGFGVFAMTCYGKNLNLLMSHLRCYGSLLTCKNVDTIDGQWLGILAVSFDYRQPVSVD
jgi:hypothetical protein